MTESIQAAIRQFIQDTFLLSTTGRPLRARDSLIDLDIVDSTGFLELIGFVETRFGVIVDEPDMVEANFESIAAIESFVLRKCATPA